MGDLRPLGSEKLKGKEKIDRILELTYFNQTKPKKEKPYELIKEGVNGVYGIVKEKDHYYVKKGLNENTLEYIGGLFQKNKNKFSSYPQALKRLELLRGQELTESTKYVLRKPTNTTTETPTPEPELDAPQLEPTTEPEGIDDMGAEDLGSDLGSEETPEETKRSDYMSEVQKFAGKLGQELRDQKEKMQSDDIKYVLNMIISAVDISKLEDSDLSDIVDKFERSDEIDDVDSVDDGMGDDESVPSEDSDLESRIAKLEDLINSKFSDDEDDQEVSLDEMEDFDLEDDEEFMDLDITPELNESIKTKLSQYFK